MRKAIENFPSQLASVFRIENDGALSRADGFLLAGMGGSALAAGLLNACEPDLMLGMHRSYGLPLWFRDGLIIASSYSGNTEEVLDAFETAAKEGRARSAISTGGELLRLAEAAGVPFIRLPQTGIQPRLAVGSSAKAIVTMMRKNKETEKLANLATALDMRASEARGKQLAGELKGKIPIIYSSLQNKALAYFWKITFNETAKVPAFSNFFPELNHNEMESFENKMLAGPFHFIFISDEEDSKRISKRIQLTCGIYKNLGLPVTQIGLNGDRFFSIFSSVLDSMWAAFYLGDLAGVDQENISAIENFKLNLKQ